MTGAVQSLPNGQALRALKGSGLCLGIRAGAAAAAAVPGAGRRSGRAVERARRRRRFSAAEFRETPYVSCQAFLRKWLPGGRSGFGGGRGWALGFAVIVLLWLLSGFYRVDPDQEGIVLRWGAFDRKATPGLNYHLPSPIEEALTPMVTRVNRVEIGYRTNQAVSRTTEVPGRSR